jgi:hypothetical protein
MICVPSDLVCVVWFPSVRLSSLNRRRPVLTPESRWNPDLRTRALAGVTHNVTAVSEERSLEDHRGPDLRSFIRFVCDCGRLAGERLIAQGAGEPNSSRIHVLTRG